ncbi:hypothetical protein Tco_0723922 [Tanacetum coccineum]
MEQGTSRTRSTVTFDGLAAIQAQLNNIRREIKKVNKKLYAVQVGCEQCKGPHYTKDCPLKKEGKTLEEAYYTQFGRPFQGGGYRATAPRFYQRNNANPSKITLRVGEERIVFTSVKSASSLIKRVYMLSLRERVEIDLETRLMGETLVLNRSLDPFFEDYIELNDLNESFELRRNQGDDLMPTIKEGFEFTHANFFPLFYVNVMSKKFHNSIMKDKMVYKENNVIGALMNVPIFVGTFSALTDYAVLKNTDAYRDEGMGNVIFGEPFLREVRIKARRFDGMITIYNGNDEVTYQMVRSHPRFKRHTNEQCKKILPLLKVSEEDEMNGISHAYQKLKGFYKGVLNLGPDYTRDEKTEEWLTRGHISVHEMKW